MKLDLHVMFDTLEEYISFSKRVTEVSVNVDGSVNVDLKKEKRVYTKVNKARADWAKPNAKLDPEKVMAIKKLIRAGKNNTEICKMFGVSCVTISYIRRGKIWTEITLPVESIVDKRVSHKNVPEKSDQLQEPKKNDKDLSKRISTEDVIKIKKLFLIKGMKLREVSEKSGYPISVVSAIKCGRTYKNVEIPEDTEELVISSIKAVPEYRDQEVMEMNQVEDDNSLGSEIAEEIAEEEIEENELLHPVVSCWRDGCGHPIISKVYMKDDLCHPFCSGGCYRKYVNSDQWRKDHGLKEGAIKEPGETRLMTGACNVEVDLTCGMMMCVKCGTKGYLSGKEFTPKVRSEIDEFKNRHKNCGAGVKATTN